MHQKRVSDVRGGYRQPRLDGMPQIPASSLHGVLHVVQHICCVIVEIAQEHFVLQLFPTAEAVVQCVRIHPDGRVATVYLKRRDLLRLFALDPRDLRRIDPNLQYTRSSPTLYVRDNLILAQLAGARLIITASTSLLLDPHCPAARKLLGELIPKLQVIAGNRLLQGAMRENPARERSSSTRSHTSSHRHSHSHGHGHGSHGGHSPSSHGDVPDMPFELDVVEATLHISISKLDAELVRAQALVQSCLQRLPRDITPQNLDELRKAKSALVELESKSDAYR